MQAVTYGLDIRDLGLWLDVDSLVILQGDGGSVGTLWLALGLCDISRGLWLLLIFCNGNNWLLRIKLVKAHWAWAWAR